MAMKRRNLQVSLPEKWKIGMYNEIHIAALITNQKRRFHARINYEYLHKPYIIVFVLINRRESV